MASWPPPGYATGVDRVRHSLEPPSRGPMRVVRRGPKVFVLELPTGARDTVSVDRLKPAHLPAPADPPGPSDAEPLARQPPQPPSATRLGSAHRADPHACENPADAEPEEIKTGDAIEDEAGRADVIIDGRQAARPSHNAQQASRSLPPSTGLQILFKAQ